MSVLTSICDENAAIEKELDRFIEQYDHMPDEKRIHDIGYILDLLHHALESKQNHLLPIARNKPDLTRLTEVSYQRYQSIEEILEKMLNIHIDEPDNEFKERAIQLRDMFHEQFQLEVNSLIPQLEALLTPDEQEVLGRYLISRFSPAPSIVPNARV